MPYNLITEQHLNEKFNLQKDHPLKGCAMGRCAIIQHDELDVSDFDSEDSEKVSDADTAS